jgi:hypothetical protein
MRKVCLAALFVFVGAKPASAQNWANKMFGGDPNTAIVHDFGLVALGAQLEANLKMTNIWQVPLSIDVRATCTCVEAIPSKKTLQPMETGTLTIKLDGTRLPGGPKTVNLYVTVSNPQFKSVANILVSANARKDIVLNPGEIDFDKVQRGSTVDRSLEVEAAGKPLWKITHFNKGPNAPFDLKMESLPVRTNAGAQVIGFRLIATLKPNAPVGPFREPVDLFTNDPVQQKVTFMVSGTILSPITVSQNPVQPIGLKVGQTHTEKIVLSANQAFRIVSIQGNDADGKLTAPEGADKNHFVQVHITPKTAGPLNREFILQTDLRNETVKVVVKGNVNP